MPIINKIKYLVFLTVLFSFPSCKKYLDEKSDQQLVVPSALQDIHSLLEEPNLINQYDPGALELSADDYYLTNSDYSGLDEFLRNMYIWKGSEAFAPGNNNDWVNSYNKIYITNVVLDNVDKIKRIPGDQTEWNNTKGSALFIRSKTFAQIAWTWASAYDSVTANLDLGIPLRLDADFNKPSIRASLEETYRQIIKDFEESISLLPDVPVHVVSPSKPAAYAWLARTYLSMRKYDSALVYADKCLQLKSDLMDYNLLDPMISPPINSYNPEVIYHSLPRQVIGPFADTILYSSYDANDLRKDLFFYPVGINEVYFQGSYDGSGYSAFWFTGIATDEVYLMRAECFARTNRIAEGMADLNKLMKNRWKNTVPFPTFTAVDKTQALTLILNERRKELVYRGLRWMDVKRLNKEGANIVLRRIVSGQTYSLQPNDPKYALPIPEDVIKISGMQQN